MSFEYLSVRLKALRSRFIDDSDIESLLSGKELSSIVLLLNDSIFREEVEKLTARVKKNISQTGIERCLSEGYLTVVQKVFNIIRRMDPKTAEVVFSRWELEQIKYAIRYYSHSEPIYERRFRFLPLFTKSGWVANWRSYQSVSHFKQALEAINHPFVSAIEINESHDGAAQVEINLERHYFQKYLHRNKSFVEETWEYFIDQNDTVNIQQCYLLRGNPEYYDRMEKYFIAGPGRFKLEDCMELVRAAPAEFRRRVEEKLACRLKEECESSSAIFSLTLRQFFLRKYLRKTIENPQSLWDVFHFLEEFKAMVSNLKLAIRLSRAGVPHHEVTDYIVQRKIA